MDFKQLFTEDRAVSPVIGVILMVAITVILAAVIGTFVLGLGDQVSESAPQAQFTFDYTDGTNDVITVTHDGGDAIDAGDLNVSVSGASPSAANRQYTWSNLDGTSDSVSAGETAVLNQSNLDGGTPLDLSGSTIRVIWSSPNSDSTATIGQFEA
jgi:flagellin-like protein